MDATATRRSMWRRCSKGAVCCSISVKLPRFPRESCNASTRSSSPTRISIISSDSTICFVSSWGARRPCIYHKLQGYRWDLVEGYGCELIFIVNELRTTQSILTTRFRLRRAFAGEPSVSRATCDGIFCDEPSFRVSAVILEHHAHAPCLGFALQEAAHVNIWKNRLMERGLPVGPWLRSFKRAIVEGCTDDHLITVEGAASGGRVERLGNLRDLLTVTPGQKIAYVTDVADTPANRAAIVELAQNADILFIEGAFAGRDAELARQRAHLTTTAAGQIAREANVRRVEPFHFSPRYAGEEQRLLAEVMAALTQTS